jgi:hypothetical protein
MRRNGYMCKINSGYHNAQEQLIVHNGVCRLNGGGMFRITEISVVLFRIKK